MLISVRRFLLSLLVVFGLYCLAPILLFDFSEAATPYDEETYGGRSVSFGPRPRWIFCSPTYANFFFKGDEWALRAYKPLCIVWVRKKGYALPANWRNEGN